MTFKNNNYNQIMNIVHIFLKNGKQFQFNRKVGQYYLQPEQLGTKK